MLKIIDIADVERGEVAYITAEALIRRIVSDGDLSLDRKISDLEDALLAIKTVIRELEEWKVPILASNADDTLEDYQDQMRKYFEAENSMIDLDNFVYGLAEESIPNVLIDLPLEVEKILDEAQFFLETVLLARRQISEKEVAKIIQGSPDPAKATVPEAQVRFWTIQWFGKAEDFHRLIDYLEKLMWLEPGSHGELSRFFFDIDGNPMNTNTDIKTPLKRVKWVGDTIDFYRLSWYLEDSTFLPVKHQQKFARLFLDRNGKPMREDSSAQKDRDGKYGDKLDPRVKDFIERILENKRK